MSVETDEFRSSPTRKLRLKPLQPSELPPHPSLTSFQSNSDVTLRDFVREVLKEAVDFSDNVIPSTFQSKGSGKKSPPSTAKVTLLSSELLRGEAWFARQSIHENAPLDGTAHWDEFEAGLFDNHSEHEMTYTPSIYDAHKVLDWSEQISENGGDFGVEYEEVAMEIFEMCHEMPGPLSNRTFCTLVTRAFTRAGAFVVAQIPVKLKGVPNAIYANGENQTKGSDARKRSKVVIGEYVSVERVREQDDGHVMWEMATASDAKGFLPMSVQKMGVPGAIVKDVGMFMKQAAEKRKSPAHGQVEELAKPEDVVAQGEPGPVEEDNVANHEDSGSNNAAVAKGHEPLQNEADSAYAQTPRPDGASSPESAEATAVADRKDGHGGLNGTAAGPTTVGS